MADGAGRLTAGRTLALLLLGLFVLLQYRLWFAEGSLAEQHRLEQQVDELQQLNLELARRNQRLESQVDELRTGLDGIEQRARSELGLVRDGELFYQFVEPQKDVDPQRTQVEISLPEGVALPEEKQGEG